MAKVKIFFQKGVTWQTTGVVMSILGALLSLAALNFLGEPYKFYGATTMLAVAEIGFIIFVASFLKKLSDEYNNV